MKEEINEYSREQIEQFIDFGNKNSEDLWQSIQIHCDSLKSLKTKVLFLKKIQNEIIQNKIFLSSDLKKIENKLSDKPADLYDSYPPSIIPSTDGTLSPFEGNIYNNKTIKFYESLESQKEEFITILDEMELLNKLIFNEISHQEYLISFENNNSKENKSDTLIKSKTNDKNIKAISEIANRKALLKKKSNLPTKIKNDQLTTEKESWNKHKANQKNKEFEKKSIAFEEKIQTSIEDHQKQINPPSEDSFKQFFQNKFIQSNADSLKEIKDQILQLRNENPFLRRIYGSSEYCLNICNEIINKSEVAYQLYKNNRVSTLYISGQPGTGKSLISESIAKGFLLKSNADHYHRIDCSVLPPNINDIFEKFSGVICLDNILSASIEFQNKLKYFIEKNQTEGKPIFIISITNEDIDIKIQDKKIISSLPALIGYKNNVITTEPINTRFIDIIPIIQKTLWDNDKVISEEAVACILKYFAKGLIINSKRIDQDLIKESSFQNQILLIKQNITGLINYIKNNILRIKKEHIEYSDLPEEIRSSLETKNNITGVISKPNLTEEIDIYNNFKYEKSDYFKEEIPGLKIEPYNQNKLSPDKENEFINKVFIPFFYGMYEAKDQACIVKLMEIYHKTIIDYLDQRNRFSNEGRACYEYLLHCLIYYEVFKNNNPTPSYEMKDVWYSEGNYEEVLPNLRKIFQSSRYLKTWNELGASIHNLFMGYRDFQDNNMDGEFPTDYIPNIGKFYDTKNKKFSLIDQGAWYRRLDKDYSFESDVKKALKQEFKNIIRVMNQQNSIDINLLGDKDNITDWRVWFKSVISNCIIHHGVFPFPHHILIASFFILEKAFLHTDNEITETGIEKEEKMIIQPDWDHLKTVKANIIELRNKCPYFKPFLGFSCYTKQLFEDINREIKIATGDPSYIINIFGEPGTGKKLIKSVIINSLSEIRELDKILINISEKKEDFLGSVPRIETRPLYQCQNDIIPLLQKFFKERDIVCEEKAFAGIVFFFQIYLGYREKMTILDFDLEKYKAPHFKDEAYVSKVWKCSQSGFVDAFNGLSDNRWERNVSGFKIYFQDIIKDMPENKNTFEFNYIPKNIQTLIEKQINNQQEKYNNTLELCRALKCQDSDLTRIDINKEYKFDCDGWIELLKAFGVDDKNIQKGDAHRKALTRFLQSLKKQGFILPFINTSKGKKLQFNRQAVKNFAKNNSNIINSELILKIN